MKTTEYIDHLKKEISNLRVFTDFYGAIKCPKCSAYRNPLHICYRCGHDPSITKKVQSERG